MNFLLSPPTPFFVSPEHKKRIEQIQNDFLYRMKKEDEPKFYAYLEFLIGVMERK